MENYKYFKPKDLNKALNLLAENKGNAAVLAGGTDLMVQIHRGLKNPGILIDITDVEELQRVVVRQDFVEIGAAVTHTRLNEHPEIVKYFPALAEAAGEVGSPQIRNQATIGGNLGNGSPAADVVPALYVLDAEAIIQNSVGTRRVKVVDLPVSPGKISLEPDELITGFVIPKPNSLTSSAFAKLGKRKALAISVVNAAVGVELDQTNSLKRIKVAVGSVAPTTLALTELEETLKGQEYSDELLNLAEQKASELVKPISDIRSTESYRRRVTGALVRKALVRALERVLNGS